MKKLVMLCLVAMMVVAMSLSAAALTENSKWGKDHPFCKIWVDRYSDGQGEILLGKQPTPRPFNKR